MIDVTRFRPSASAVIAALAAVGAVAGSYAVAGLTPAFAAAPLEQWLSRAMPGWVLTIGIQQLGSVGQQLNLLGATVLTALAIATMIRLTIAIGDQFHNRAVPVVLGGALTWAFVVLLTGTFASASGSALGAVAVLGIAHVLPAVQGLDSGLPDRDRRHVLSAAATAVGLGALAATRAPSTGRDTVDSIPEDASPEVKEHLQRAQDQSLDVAGIEPLVSRDFYNVDINAADPNVDADSWSLSVTGEVETERTYSLADLRSMDARTEFNTLRCVGEPLNGKKLDNALWTGVPTSDLLAEADPNGDCDCVKLHAADGYFQVFPVEALEDGFLAYRMNGRDLPRAHGYPLRALVPGHWGEVQVKWLTEIELLERDAEGYWEKRGWHGTGPVSTVAKLHAVTDIDGSRKQVAGHAYAGTRGISAVEVSTDGGDSWTEATLSDPLPGDTVEQSPTSSQTASADDVWRQWAFEYEPPGGRHEVVVRAIEADGTVQTKEETDSFPSGATGWVSKRVS